jgi:hypothetical protein
MYQPCFRQASAASLPFANRSFDAVMSTDVLEHVEAAYVKMAVAEMARVAKTRIYVKISNRGEFNRRDIDTLKKSGMNVPAALHSTIQGPPFWEALFSEHSWTLLLMFEDMPAGRRWWDCCTYVFQPSTPEAIRYARLATETRAKSGWYRASVRLASPR